jgi:membrane-associated phospholipid phosphatase/tRNA A-37 threonylcarbamoyl transferase component Bud32
VSSVPETFARQRAVPATGAPARTSARRRRPSGEAPPLPRQLNRSGRYWLAALVALLLVLAAGLIPGTAVYGAVVDSHISRAVATLRTEPLTHVMKAIGLLATPRAVQVMWWLALAILLITRRWRQLFVWIGAMVVVTDLAGSLNYLLERPRPLAVEILGPWTGYSMPSLPMAVLAATAVNSLYSLVPRGHVRQVGKWIVAGILTLVAFSRVYLGQDALSDVLAGLVIGVAIPLAAFRLFAPGDVFPVTYGHRRSAHVDVTGVRHDAIVQAMSDQLGVVAEEIKPFGLEGSGGSTPLRVKVKSDPDTYLFCKLYAATHLRSDRWYKLGRTLLYGRLEDEKPFNTVRRLVQYEDYALRVLYAAGLPVPKSCGIVEITPEREYILAMEFADGSKEIGEVDVDESLMDQGMVIVRRLWEAGLAHRDIKPANLLVRDGRLLLIDSAFTEIRPSPWRQAVDLANMMLVLALRSTPERVLARAQVFFSDEEIAEAFAATRGLTMPSQLRKLMRAQGRDLHAEFLRLLPVRLPPIAIQNWTWRRVALLIVVLLAGIFAVMITIPLLSSPL